MGRSGARGVIGWTWAASIAVHAVFLGGAGWLALRSIGERETRVAEARVRAGEGTTIEVELPGGVARGALVANHVVDPRGDPPPQVGGAPSPSLDQDRRGRGGEPTVDAPATNLSDRDDRLSRTTDLLDRLDRTQQSRLKTNPDRTRASWEDRRSSKEPMELTFVAQGAGARQQRRAPSDFDPSRGANAPIAPSALGGAPGDTPSDPSDDALDARFALGAPKEGTTESGAGLGVRDGRAGRDHRLSARVARARPDVTTAAVSVPAARNGRPRDDVDSDQEVAAMVHSIIHASTAGGTVGAGRGGSANGGEAGAGGAVGAGATGRPMGDGDEWWDMTTSDPRLVPYFRRIKSKLDPLWAHAFPLQAALELKQGTVIFDVTIAKSGAVSVAWPPRRASGVPEFDRNCYEAIQRGAPFEPIPDALHASELHVRMPFDARNYVVAR